MPDTLPPEPASNHTQWMTLKQVAARVGASVAGVNGWIVEGVKTKTGQLRLKAVKVGTRWRLDPAAVVEFIQAATDAALAHHLAAEANEPPAKRRGRPKGTRRKVGDNSTAGQPRPQTQTRERAEVASDQNARTPLPTYLTGASTTQAAELLGVHFKRVKTWIAVGLKIPSGRVRLPAVKLGTGWRIAHDDLTAFGARPEVKAAAGARKALLDARQLEHAAEQGVEE